MSLLPSLQNAPSVFVRQRRELAELVGFETRNKYEILTEGGLQIGFAAEQGKGIFGFLGRHFLGHWRRFEVLFFDIDKNPILRCNHPFRWIFQRFEVRKELGGDYLGAIQSRFALFSKRFTVEGPSGETLFEVSSPIWRIWTFPFIKNGVEMAKVEKKWSGGLTEIFTDRDNFRLSFVHPELSDNERALLLASSVFIDLQYFENKAQ